MSQAELTKQSAERRFPIGTMVEMVHCDDPHDPIAPGDKGVVEFIDDMGTLFVKWESGRSLGVVLGVDRIRKL